MAQQNIKINVGTSYNGEGITKAVNGLDSLSKQANKTKGDIGKISTAVDSIGNSVGASGGKIATVLNTIVGGLNTIVNLSKGGKGGLLAFLITCGTIGVTLGKKIFGPIREAQRAMNEEYRKQQDIINGTSKLYDRWREKWAKQKADAEKKAQKEKEEAAKKEAELAKKEKEHTDALNKSLHEQWKVEEQILKTQREMEQVQNKGEWDDAIAKETDPLQKRVLQAQAEQAQTEMTGKNKLADADYDIQNVQKELEVLKSNWEEGDIYQTKLSTKQKELELMVEKYNITFEEVTQANQRAAEALAEVVDEVEKIKRQESDFNYQQRKAIREEARKQEERGKLEEQIKDIDKRILDAKKKVQDSERVRQSTQNGMNADNTRHSGISGRGYEYSTDENGNLNRFDQFRRAQRYARNEAHGGGGGDGDNTYNANAQKAIKLQGKLNSGKKLSKQDQQWLDDWNDFNNQDNTAQDQLDELKEIKNKLVECLGIK